MKPYKEIDVIPGSASWLEWRKTCITATDSAKLLGLNPYATSIDVYTEKKEDKKSFINEAMQRGMDLEPLARTFISQKYGFELNPIVVESTELEYLGASLDAVSNDRKMGIEIKCPGTKTITAALNGHYDEMYNIQCQKQMYVMGWKRMILFFYHNDFVNKEFNIERDDELIKKIIESDSLFYHNHLLTQSEPDKYANYIKQDDKILNDLAHRWKELYSAKKEIDGHLKDIEAKLKEHANGENTLFVHAGVKHQVIDRKGLIDWSNVCEKWQISKADQEEYRSKSSSYIKLSKI